MALGLSRCYKIVLLRPFGLQLLGECIEELGLEGWQDYDSGVHGCVLQWCLDPLGPKDPQIININRSEIVTDLPSG